MLNRNVSGQFLFLSLVNVSGNSQIGASGAISGRKLIDANPMVLLSGNIIETSGGTYRVNLHDFDTDGNNIGYFFTASGCLPILYNVPTVEANSGKIWLASGAVDLQANRTLTYDVSGAGTPSVNSLYTVVQMMNFADTTTNSGKLTVFKPDGTTEFVQKPITILSGAAAIVNIG